MGEDKVTGDAFAVGEETGHDEACLAAAGEAETLAAGAGDAGVLANSRRSALWLVLLCAYKTARAKVSTKKMPANHAVILTRTVVVCAPKMFSVTDAPKAAPKPSLLGRCIKMTNTRSTQTTPKMAKRKLIRIDIGTGNMPSK